MKWSADQIFIQVSSLLPDRFNLYDKINVVHLISILRVIYEQL